MAAPRSKRAKLLGALLWLNCFLAIPRIRIGAFGAQAWLKLTRKDAIF